MKIFVIAVATAAFLGGSAYAQNAPVIEPAAPVTGAPAAAAGAPQARDSKTTTGQAPVAVPRQGNSYGASGGAIGQPNPDRVPTGTSGGQSEPPGN
jgi:hypothetical protein